MFPLLVLLGFGILVLGFMAGCGGGGSGETSTTTTTTTTTGGGTTTTTAVSYRIMGTVHNAAGNPTNEVGVMLLKHLVSTEAACTVEGGTFTGGIYHYNLVTTEAGTYYVIAMSPFFSTTHYIGAPGITDMSFTGLQPVTVEAGTLIMTVETFTLFPLIL